MSIKVGEIGKKLYVGAQFDLSGNTSLEYEVTNPSGATKTLMGVTAPAVDSPNIPDVGVFPANTYGDYTVQDGDFDVAGTWKIRIVYKDATPKLFYGDCADLVIEECD